MENLLFLNEKLNGSISTKGPGATSLTRALTLIELSLQYQIKISFFLVNT